MFDMEKFAGRLYERYCQAVGGKAYDGKPLPSWKEFRGDEVKRTQIDAWIEVAEAAFQVVGETLAQPQQSQSQGKPLVEVLGDGWLCECGTKVSRQKGRCPECGNDFYFTK
jgi:hypothetical protein